MIVHPYAGPGGMSEGLRTLGHTDIGIETDPAACATRNAAGHRTVRADATTYPLDHLAGKVDGLIVTPPCQAFSTAGNGAGRDVLAELAAAISVGDWTGHVHDDERVRHVLEVGRWAETLRPRWVVCEQVPPVLSLWRTYAARWRTFGWSTWAGVLLAADFGVPQTRRRAFLIARTDGQTAVPPEPTHCQGGASTMFGDLAPWVTMANALGWGYDRRGSPTVTGGGGATGGPEPFGHAARIALRSWTLNRRQQHEGEPARLVDCDTEPAPTLTGTADTKSQWVFREVQANGAVRSLDEPAMTISSSADNGNFRFERVHESDGDWWHNRPATTVVGDGRAFGPHSGSAGEPQSSNAIKLTIRDALVLQGFPPDYPVQGTRTAQFRQVGDAVPPPLASSRDRRSHWPHPQGRHMTRCDTCGNPVHVLDAHTPHRHGCHQHNCDCDLVYCPDCCPCSKETPMTDTDPHPEEHCGDCGQLNISTHGGGWYTTSDRWRPFVTARYGHDMILCPQCFVTCWEEQTGLVAIWRLEPDPATIRDAGHDAWMADREATDGE